MSETTKGTGLPWQAMFRIRLRTWLAVTAIVTCLAAKGKRNLKIWGIEGSLFSLTNLRR